MGCMQRLPDLGGRSLDTDPDFGRYWKFCGTIINVHTNRNQYKRGTQNQLIKIRDAMDRLYLKNYYS